MSREEFREAGLQKQSPQELDALNQWLLRYTATEAPQLKRNNDEVRETDKNYAIESTIAGEFSGWTGKTVFSLANGQRWQQRMDGRYAYKGPSNPAVSISKNWMGFYILTLTESGRSIGVSRLQ